MYFVGVALDDTGFDEARADSERLGSLDPYAELLSHQRHAVLRRFSHLSPISAFPIIHYIEKKALEVRNLRLLVRGKAVGLQGSASEAHGLRGEKNGDCSGRTVGITLSSSLQVQKICTTHRMRRACGASS